MAAIELAMLLSVLSEGLLSSFFVKATAMKETKIH